MPSKSSRSSSLVYSSRVERSPGRQLDRLGEDHLAPRVVEEAAAQRRLALQRPRRRARRPAPRAPRASPAGPAPAITTSTSTSPAPRSRAAGAALRSPPPPPPLGDGVADQREPAELADDVDAGDRGLAAIVQKRHVGAPRRSPRPTVMAPTGQASSQRAWPTQRRPLTTTAVPPTMPSTSPSGQARTQAPQPMQCVRVDVRDTAPPACRCRARRPLPCARGRGAAGGGSARA